jgi:hypothetical protein
MAKTWKVHPTAMAFPRISGDELNELRADIEENGIRVSILVNKKKDTILDGRNRMMIAHDLKLKETDVPIEIFKGKPEDEIAEIISRNLHRRHLTDDQRAAIVAKVLGPELAKEAEARKVTGKAGDLGMKSTQGGVVGESTQGRTRERIAAVAQVGDHKARAALLAREHASDELDNVIDGKLKLALAARRAKARAFKKKKIRPKPEKTLQERVEARFLRFMESFAVSESREVRKILKLLLTK